MPSILREQTHTFFVLSKVNRIARNAVIGCLDYWWGLTDDRKIERDSIWILYWCALSTSMIFILKGVGKY